MSYVELAAHGTERILGIKLSTSSHPAHIFSLYAQTLCYEAELKYNFYESLDSVVANIPTHESQYVLGDARVGADHNAWSTTMGSHGIGKKNDKGQRFLELCSTHNMCVTNNFSNARTSTKCHGYNPVPSTCTSSISLSPGALTWQVCSKHAVTTVPTATQTTLLSPTALH